MSQGKRNVPISSLLDSTAEEPASTNTNTTNQSSVEVRSRSNSITSRTGNSGAVPLRNLVSQFQTSIFPGPSSEPIVIDDDDVVEVTATSKGKSPPQTTSNKNGHNNGSNDTNKSNTNPRSKRPVLIRPSPSLPVLVPKPTISPSPQAQPISNGKGVVPSEQIRKFQTSFQLAASPQPSPAPTPASKPPLSKTSINSIINIDDEPEVIAVENNKTPTPSPSGPPPTVVKRKRAPAKKKEGGPEANKRRKPGEGAAGNRKTPDPTTAKEDAKTTPPKLVVHSGMTTENIKTGSITLPAAEVIAIVKDDHKNEEALKTEASPTTSDKKKEETVEKEKEKVVEQEKEKPEFPIIALNIPLIDPKNPKPGQAEVVINVLALAEEKYGFKVIHPNAKSVIDNMDEILVDDDEEGEEDDEEDDDEEKEREREAAARKRKEEEELTEEQKVRRHEARIARKVGKYDYEDPFIDDQELQMEDEIATTKEGFFVYWGPLVDDRSITGTNAKKGASKGKK